ncbi:hypothetical protein KFK09_005647 [Dendrobium nobile]|uniref:Retrovirus-related Pol polyprotein from transposon TNT 1-94-like beta-barrel domain-containing protein n=1 Tax=Dendrobium nobile TaxID=94219 RepID=A0A8T3C145_DENNO|nr:hypothetical protein KFK09_005647 [Dendrobium nobile]
MAEEDSTGSRQNISTISNRETDLLIPPHLKFLISNIKNLVPTSLTSENYSIWRLQLFQHFSANGLDDHLTGHSVCPPETDEPERHRWTLVDRNLVSTLLSTISSSILPYVISLRMAHDVWTTLECRLQPTNRSRVIQLKNELHQVQMCDQTMHQYLDQIKKIVDNIAAAGSTVDNEDIVLYILNGLPTAYNPFKTAIRTSLHPINLDDLYSLLSSEEINIQHQQAQETLHSDSMALFTNRSQNYRSKSSKFRGRSNVRPSAKEPARQPTSDPQVPTRNQSQRPQCQICRKMGHSVINCWHQCNLSYAPPTNPRALTAQQQQAATSDWILDSGASSHLTADVNNLQQSAPYNGLDSISIANGSNLSIQNSGQSLLPLPDSNSKLNLKNILHVPSISHNLLSVSRLTSDNNISISFTSHQFVIKNLQDN